MAALSEGIPTEILSQGDNWFVFHLLSAADLTSLKRANAHFSDDILSSLLNEPIAGQGVFWSSAGKRAYPIPLSTLSFESLYQVDELIASGPAVETYASRLKDRFAQALKDAQSDLEGSRYPEGIPGASKARDVPGPEVSTVAGEEETREDPRDEEEVDALRLYKTRAVQKVRQRRDQMARLRGEPGLAWGYLMGLLRDQLPETLEDRGDVAYYLVREVLDEELGPGSWESHWVQRPDRRINYVRALPQKE